jgi:hypothetical protein
MWEYGKYNKGIQCKTLILMFCLVLTDVKIGWLFIVLRPTQEFFTYMELSPLPV